MGHNVKIRMSSGEEYLFYTHHNNISDWINSNFSNKGASFTWYIPYKGSKVALKFENIESAVLLCDEEVNDGSK